LAGQVWPANISSLTHIVGAAVAEDAVANLGIDGGLGARDARVGAGLDARLEHLPTSVIGVRRGETKREQQRR